MNQPPNVLILGIGNVLWADEGFGVRAVEALHRHYQFPEQVQLLDGGTQGIYLVQYVQVADILVVFDAVDYGLPAGTIKEVYDDDVPKFMAAKKMSLHQTGFQEVLGMAQFTGQYPKHLFLIGVQPEELDDYGGSLRPGIKAQLQPAIDLALNYLQGFGVEAQRRETPLPEHVGLGPEGLDMQTYEAERPSEEQACRTGDPRVIGDKS